MKSQLTNLSWLGISVSIYLFFLPFVSSANLFYSTVNAKYFYVSFLFFIVSVSFALFLIKTKQNIIWKNRILLGLSGVTLVSFFLASFLGVDVSRSFFSDILRSSGLVLLIYIFFIAFVLAELLNKKDWSVVFKSISFSGILFSIFTIITALFPDILKQFIKLDIANNGLSLGNETFAGAFLLLTSLITLVAIKQEKKYSVTKKLLFFGFLFEVISPLFINWGAIFSFNLISIIDNPLVLIGGARSSSITLILVTLYLIGIYISKHFKNIEYKKALDVLWSGVFIIAIIFLVSNLFIRGSLIQNIYINVSTEARILVWESGISAFKEKPLLGWGPENFNYGFEKYFNNKLYLKENIGEIWFDRAHNILIDSLVNVGVIGSLLILSVVIYLVLIFNSAYKRGIVSFVEARLLQVLLFAHFLQLQTSFDTISTYLVMGLILSYGLWLEKELIYQSVDKLIKKNNDYFVKIFGYALLCAVTISFWKFGILEYSRQRSLVEIFRTNDSNEQLNLIEKSFSQRIGFEDLRITSSSLVKGLLEQTTNTNKSNIISKNDLSMGLLQLDLYIKFYDMYLSTRPDDYRARMNYSYLLMVKTIFGNNQIVKAKSIITDSYTLSPNNPLTFALDSMANLYSGDIKKSKEIMNKGLGLNPNITFSNEIIEYINRQEKSFPEITFLKLYNL